MTKASENKKSLPQWAIIFIGLGLGVLVGLVLYNMGGEDVPLIRDRLLPLFQFFGDLFIRAIQMTLVPLVFFSILNATISLGDISRLRSIGLKTVVWFLFSSSLAALVGLVVANLVKPGVGIDMGTAVQGTVDTSVTELPGPLEILLDLIPQNPIQSMVEGEMMQIIVFALILGLAILALPQDKTKNLRSIIETLAQAMIKMIGFVVKIIPLGVFGLMAVTITKFGAAVFGPVAKFIFTDYLAAIIVSLGFYSLALVVFARLRPLPFFKKAFEAWMAAFSTCTSSVALPISMKNVPERMGVDREVSDFVLPLGATANMDGTNMYFAVVVVFAAQLFGMDLSISQQIFIVIQGTLLSIGTAAVPQVGLVISISLLTDMGLPLDAIALVSGIYRIVDQIHTATNSLGDQVTSLVVARSEGQIDEDVYYDMSL